MSSNLARSTSFNFFSLSEIIQESYPHLDTDCNSSCVDIFTVDTNAQMDLLGVYDVYLDTDTNSSCVDISTVDTNAQMDLLGVYDVYISTRILTRVALTFLVSTPMLRWTFWVCTTYISRHGY